MVSLITVEDVEVALGRSAQDGAEEAQWQQKINHISAFIDGYVDVSFTVKTDHVIRAQADYYGVIYLGGDPVSTVSSIAHVGDTVAAGVPLWDGLHTIYGLEPLEVVDITYTHGYSSIPEEIKAVCLEGVLAVLGLGEQGTSGPIRQVTVGDVTESYAFTRDTFDGATTVSVVLSGDVLKRYCKQMGTFRLGASGFPPHNPYAPANAFQIGIDLP